MPLRRDRDALCAQRVLLPGCSAVLKTCVLVFAVFAQAPAGEADPRCRFQVPAEIETQIAFFAGQVREDEHRYPALALLASAHLKRATWSGDAGDIKAARDFARRSIEVQPNLGAFKVLAASSNYGHRFAETLPWCDKAEAAAPGERQVLAMRTEALIGLGRLDDLERILETAPTSETDFYLPACKAQLLAARGERAQALEAYRQVAKLADAAKANDVALWARVAAAGVCLDSGHPDEAIPFLKEAEGLAADDPDVIVHRAEYDEATGDAAKALAAYERLLQRQCNPELHRRVAKLLRAEGNANDAARHFDEAERLWRAALEQGEVYPLEGLANLYCDAGVRLDEAVRLAEQNLKHKQDAAARETLQRAIRLRDAE
jgi:tetratricopeptide (TPR) repeat protein